MNSYQGFTGWSEIRHLATTTAALVAGVIIPNRFDTLVIDAWNSYNLRRHPERVEVMARRMEQQLGPGGSTDYSSTAEAYYRRQAEAHWGRARNQVRRGWNIRSSVNGVEHIRQAQKGGRGVVLWQMSFGGIGAIPTKAALWEAGIPIIHLSRVQHGLGRTSWVSVRLISPFYRRAEDWYLQERVEIPLNDSLDYMRVLIDRLRTGGVVSIMGEEEGRQQVSVPLLAGSASFPTGSPALAHKLGATLLPVHTFRTGDMAYATVVDTPIEVDREVARAVFVKQAIEDFAARLERRVRQHPSDWDGWARLSGPAKDERLA